MILSFFYYLLSHFIYIYKLKKRFNFVLINISVLYYSNVFFVDIYHEKSIFRTFIHLIRLTSQSKQMYLSLFGLFLTSFLAFYNTALNHLLILSLYQSLVFR